MNVKKQIWLVLLAVLSCIGLLIGCSFDKSSIKSNLEPSKPTVQEIQKSGLTPEKKVEASIDAMTTEEKVGQLFIIGVHGTAMNDDIRFMLTEYKYGGVIFFDRNMENKAQVKTFISDIKKTGKTGSDFPLFVAIDQEGGVVSRMADQLIQVPFAEILGQQDKSVAVDFARKSGKELKDLGFNVNFAPDADLGLGNERSYSNNPDYVIPFAHAVGQAYHDSGLVFSYKHFPGIGKTNEDLHDDSSIVDADEQTLLTQDVRVFRELAQKTPANTYMMMVSHAVYPNLDPNIPSSLSRKIITDILRKQIGYTGVVITDDLEMGAVANHYSFADMAVQSILAGSDILLVCHEYEHMQEAYNGVLKAVKEGKISQQRLNESVKRVLMLKQQMK